MAHAKRCAPTRGQLNTCQSRTVYAEDNDAPRWSGVPGVHPWAEFVPPTGPAVRHGRWLTQVEFEQHATVRGAKVERRGDRVAIAESHGWRDFTEGVDSALVEGGRVVRTFFSSVIGSLRTISSD